MHGGFLFIAVQRLDRDYYWVPVPPSCLAVIDTATNTLVDVDGTTPGVQGIELPSTNPYRDIHVDETTGLIDAATLARMQPTAGLVNVSRGQVVDTNALVEALAGRTLAWAALDVTDPEPMPADHPLLALPRATVIPRLGSSTHRTRAAMAELAARNLIEALAGRPMPARAN